MAADINSQELKTIINEKNWNQLLEKVKPRYFLAHESKLIPDASILAQMCQVLVSEAAPPDTIKILCLKCLGNSCLDIYKYKRHAMNSIKVHGRDSINLYNELVESDLCKQDDSCDYPHNTHFPYDGAIEWTVDYIKTHGKSTDCLTDNELDILRLSIQFLCNLFTYACPITSLDNTILCLRYIKCNNLKEAILNCMQSDHKSLASAASIYVHNALRYQFDNVFTMDKDLCLQLLKPIKEGLTSARETLLFLLQNIRNVFEDLYNSMAMSEKLDLLEIIYDEIRESWQSDLDRVLTKEQAEFLALTFCQKSDLILNTVDTCANSVDPTEIILILDILGPLTMQCKISENARCLLINCKYLLMSLHTIGKETDNYFTPITNLSQVAPNARGRAANACSTSNTEATTANCDPEEHPAYAFKAKLIRVIANMVHKSKMCQNLFRELDGIPLLLDCCNIDARNPLILQWSILALRNLCEGNLENQAIIRDSEKMGVPNNLTLQEMGLTLHEDADGKSIGIAPLRRN